MRPLNSRNFGSTGIAVTFYNGTATVTGYIVKQLGVNRFTVTDGTVVKNLYLAPTTEIATSIGSSYPDNFTIPLNPYSSASGATFTPHYAPSNISIALNGAGYNGGDVITINGTTGAQITITATDTFGQITDFVISHEGGGVSSFPTNPQDLVFQSGGASFQGTISGTTLTVTSMTSGTIKAQQALVGAGLAGSATIIDFDTGSGGVGTYLINDPYTISTPEAMSSHGTLGAANIDGWLLFAVPVDGQGTGYAVNDAVILNGLVGTDINVAAHVATVSDSGGPTSVTVDRAGSGITVAATSVGVSGPIEYVSHINQNRLTTTEGNVYKWSRGSVTGQSAFIPNFVA